MASYLTSRRSELVEIKRNTANREYLYTILDKEMKNSFSANSWIQASFLYNSAGQRMVSFRSFEYSLLEDVRDYNQSIISGEESFSNEWVARKIGETRLFLHSGQRRPDPRFQRACAPKNARCPLAPL